MKKSSYLFSVALAVAMCFSGFVNAGSSEKSTKYIIIDLNNGKINYTNFASLGGWPDTYKTTKLVLRRIEPGTFTMGSPASELGRFDNETQHNVTISSPFYIGVFEITQAQYSLITGQNPSQFKGDTRPVENVSYNQIYSVFFDSIKKNLGIDLDLPTDAQWEYACRAGKITAWNNGADITNVTKDKELDKLGRYLQNTNDFKGGCAEHTIVGSYLPNEWGLYDMHGNVWEWCSDWYGDLGNYMATDPKGARSGAFRVLRGGSWHVNANSCRSAVRNRYYPQNADSNFGFRVIFITKEEPSKSPSPVRAVQPVNTNTVVNLDQEIKMSIDIYIKQQIEAIIVLIKNQITEVIVEIKEWIKVQITNIIGCIVLFFVNIFGWIFQLINFVIASVIRLFVMALLFIIGIIVIIHCVNSSRFSFVLIFLLPLIILYFIKWFFSVFHF